MNADEAIKYADQWAKLIPPGLDGWRIVCKVLADEVRELRAKLETAKIDLTDVKQQHREQVVGKDQEIARLKTGHDRYEYLRKLNPLQFDELYSKNIRSGVPFDDLVDQARSQK